jgi:hypothetical protein
MLVGRLNNENSSHSVLAAIIINATNVIHAGLTLLEIHHARITTETIRK